MSIKEEIKEILMPDKLERHILYQDERNELFLRATIDTKTIQIISLLKKRIKEVKSLNELRELLK